MSELTQIKQDLEVLVRRVLVLENSQKVIKTRFGDIILNSDERYIGAIIDEDCRGYHIIRMPYNSDVLLTWTAAMDFAKVAGGELPDRVEGALLFARRKTGEFATEYHWTREQYAGNESSAWVQSFDYGGQDHRRKDFKYRFVLVRRIPIGD